MKPELIAHRGEPENYPENSLEGYRAVLGAGARYIETDIQISADGIPVLSHDPTLLKITGTELEVTKTSYRVIRELPAGQPEYFGERFMHLHITNLSEFAALLKHWPDARAFIEMKNASIAAFGVERVTDLILEALAEVVHQCMIISFLPEAVAHARKASGLPIGWVVPQWSEENRAMASVLKPEYLFCNRKRLPPPDVALWEGPWKWVVYTVNDLDEALNFASRGIDMVETNAISSLLRQAGPSGAARV
jgi:glycerophosphoryl diester phosphodiesterase